MLEGPEFPSPSVFISMASRVFHTCHFGYSVLLTTSEWVFWVRKSIRESREEKQRKTTMKQLSSSIGNSSLTNKVSAHAHTVHVEIHLPDKLLPQTSSFIISLDNYASILFFFFYFWSDL